MRHGCVKASGRLNNQVSASNARKDLKKKKITQREAKIYFFFFSLKNGDLCLNCFHKLQQIQIRCSKFPHTFRKKSDRETFLHNLKTTSKAFVSSQKQIVIGTKISSERFSQFIGFKSSRKR